MAHGCNTDSEHGSEQCLLGAGGFDRHHRTLSSVARDSANRRMRPRMSGGVRGGGCKVAPYSIVVMVTPGKPSAASRCFAAGNPKHRIPNPKLQIPKPEQKSE